MARSCSPACRPSSTIGCLRPAGHEDFAALERVGEHAWAMHDKPDAGLWELRTKKDVHTYSAAMCWAACDRLAMAPAHSRTCLIARILGGPRAIDPHADRTSAWSDERGYMSATLTGDQLDASLLQLLDLRFLSPADPRFTGTLAAVEKRAAARLAHAALRPRGRFRPAGNRVQRLHLLADRGLACDRTYSRRAELYEEMLSRRTAAGLLSEDIDPVTENYGGIFRRPIRWSA
jgi:GH15 family glucan-1,4-alpha-glucosidase